MGMIRLFVASCILLSTSTNAEEISAKGDFPGTIEKATEWLRSTAPESIGVDGAEVHLNEVAVDDVSFDPDSTLLRVRGKLTYKTGPKSFLKFKVGGGFDLKYNITTGDLEGLKLVFKEAGHEIRIDLTPIKKAIDGDLSALLEFIPNYGVIQRHTESEYDDRKAGMEQKYGKENVYFASSDFVRWASPETAGRWIAQLVVTAGGGSGVIVQEAQTQARKEFSHILKWLQGKVGGTANSAVDAILKGEAIMIPQLKLVWQPVDYQSEVKVAGQALPKTPKVRHFAFVLIWETSGKPSASADSNPGTLAADNELRPKWSAGIRYAVGQSGCRVVFVKPGGASDRAGVKVGDVIVKVNNRPVGDADQKTDRFVRELKATKEPKLDLEYLRGGASSTLQVDLDPVL